MHKTKYQKQVTDQEIAIQLLNVQETLKGVVQTLERLERVAENVMRSDAEERSEPGDRNHQDVPTNISVLSGKLCCLQGILGAYNNQSFRNQCVSYLYQWYQKRQGYYSPLLTQATFASVSACVGKFKMKLKPVKLTESQLSDCAAKLYSACSQYHDKADEVNEDPDAYLRKKHSLKVYADGRMEDADPNLVLMEMHQDVQMQKVKSEMTREVAIPQGDVGIPVLEVNFGNSKLDSTAGQHTIESPDTLNWPASEHPEERNVRGESSAIAEDSKEKGHIINPVHTPEDEKEKTGFVQLIEEIGANMIDSFTNLFHSKNETTDATETRQKKSRIAWMWTGHD